ncbi:MAG: hypothetical protein M1826_003373 [Phylliscum demangeonii]|nr:MAG: hypothetical protein M1826_003373 [Phylliscum demangeonii]
MQLLTKFVLAATILGVTVAAPAPAPAQLAVRDAPNCNTCVHNTLLCLYRAIISNPGGKALSMTNAYNACTEQAKASAICKGCPSVDRGETKR